ncbi:hypothetical protein GCM10017673_56510 [Streptosporangium violaceochromogenes]|nr:hypothetical protein GCM10017673_56510 [Streptosporangium violaceochromogenes]
MTGLPPPINGTETYLSAVYDRLGEILDRIPPRPADLQPGEEPAGAPRTVELREPAAGPAVQEPLGVDAPEGEHLKEPAPPGRTGTARKRATKKGGSS